MRRKRDKSTNAVSIIAERTEFHGKITSEDDLLVFGTVYAPADSVVAIESGARVEAAEKATIVGDIHADSVVVKGTVKGSLVVSNTLRLCKGAALLGDIKAKSLIMEDGVRFDGKVTTLVDGGQQQEEDKNVVTGQEEVKIPNQDEGE